MIKFATVRGDVLVDDRNKPEIPAILAKIGLELDQNGKYLIATNQSSSAELLLGGRKISLKPSSSLRIMGNKSVFGCHNETWHRHASWKTLLGRIWLRLDSDASEDDTRNSVIGVRG